LNVNQLLRGGRLSWKAAATTFKIRSLQPVRPFFKICFHDFFPQKFAVSFVLTGRQLS
jgi:hypothetical protein